MINNIATKIRQHRLFFAIIFWVFIIFAVVTAIFGYFLYRIYARDVENYLVNISTNLGQAIERSYKNGFAINGSQISGDYDFEQLYNQVVFDSQLVYQINIIDDQGFYIISSDTNKKNRKAALAMLEFIESEQNKMQLKRVSLDENAKILDVWQYLYNFNLPGSATVLTAQFLYEATTVKQSQGQYLSYAWAIVFLVLSVPFLAILFFYFSFLTGIKQFFGNFDSKKLDSQSSWIGSNFCNLFKQAIDKHIVSNFDKLEKNKNLPVFDTKVSQADYLEGSASGARNFSVLIVGVRVLNFLKVTSKLDSSAYLELNNEIYNTYYELAVSHDAMLLKYDGDITWFGFKGDYRYSKCLDFIKFVKIRLISFGDEKLIDLPEKLSFLFLIDEGFISMARFRVKLNKPLTVLSGEAIARSDGLIRNLDKPEVWATGFVKNKLKEHRLLAYAPELELFFGDTKQKLFSVNMDSDQVGLLEEEVLGSLKNNLDSSASLVSSGGINQALEETIRGVGF